MPRLTGPLQFTGSLDELVAYKMKNIDRIVVRRKAYIPKNAYKIEPQYTAMRANSAEFTGCAYAGKMVRRALIDLIQLADQNMAPVMTSFCKAIQKMDRVGRWGERSISFWEHKDVFLGLSFNKQTQFDSVFKQRPVVQIQREQGIMQVDIAELYPGLNFQLPWNKPYFRIVACMGAIKDLHYESGAYNNRNHFDSFCQNAVYSEWFLSGKKTPANSMIVKLSNATKVQEQDISFLGGIGIQMGQPNTIGQIVPVKYASVARILAVG